MKCPHCGMNIRDNTAVCGYCGEKVEHQPGKAAAGGGDQKFAGVAGSQAGLKTGKAGSDEPETEEEEGGGLSAILQPDEQVLIGSLNISVKKFFFHAYLTNKRIFLIDTQEKKLKVTAKDIARDTIVGSIVEFSENSDPVLVLSIKSADDEIKTMKLVFTQNGMDRSGEIDEWIALIHEEKSPKKSQKSAEEEPREEKDLEFVLPEKPVAARQELRPAKKPSKDHEKQPPVKRLLSLYKVPEEEREEERPPEPVKRTPLRQVAEPIQKPEESAGQEHGLPAREPEGQKVKKPEVQSAMKVAMKGAMHTVRQPVIVPVRRPSEPIRRSIVEREPDGERIPEHRPVVVEKTHEPSRVIAPERTQERVHERVPEKPEPEETGEKPQFCHHCGKKLPHAANFCPGCGTKLSSQRAQQSSLASRTIPQEKKVIPKSEDEEDEDLEGERPVPAKPPIKKAPKGSEMTILHKFLRR